MSDSGKSGSPDSPTGQDNDSDLMIAALRERGAHRFDPIRFRYIEALARRAAAQGGDVRRTLDRKLARALTDYGEQHERARSEAGQVLTRMAARCPGAADELHRLHVRGDFRGLHRLAARLEGRHHRGPLADLVRDIDRHSSQPGDARAADAAVAPVGPPAELRALRHFRSTWARLSVDRQLTRSLAKVPENPGPLNSHLLVLRSLKVLQDISPEYLNRFMSYVDGLLWLDQADRGSPSVPGNVIRRDGNRIRKVGRGKSG